MKILHKVFIILKNKYIITTIAFIIWMIFFDANSMINQYRLNKALEKVENEKEFYIQEIKQDKETAKGLMSNQDNLEKFAREKYLMKRDNEDVYIIIKENKNIRKERIKKNK
jgi:cell division protein FtsB